MPTGMFHTNRRWSKKKMAKKKAIARAKEVRAYREERGIPSAEVAVKELFRGREY